MAVPLPTGTITFLFTDIEGSTRRWEQQREVMQRALARHDSLMREAIEGQGGAVFKTVGDAFCAAFATPLPCLDAALAAQRGLAKEPWPENCEIRVRMALHTGAVEERDADYFGRPVNRVARLLSAGHGGQVLLSEVTAGLVRDSLPEGVGLRDLGVHRLKDLTRPEHIFQATAPELPLDSRPLETLETHRHNLPFQSTPFIGRESEIGEVVRLMRRSEVRLLTLTGPGGTGKTRLALQAAAEVLDDFPDGVFFIELAPLTDAQFVPAAIIAALGLSDTGGQTQAEHLIAHLSAQKVLLVLDNFEHVLQGSLVVGTLLAACPNLKVLTTSRIPLRLTAEREYPVPTLAVPDLQHLPPPKALSQYDAVALFIERASSVKPNFEVTNETAPAVAEICYRLDGLPLAIELAAARIRIFPPAALLQRLGNRLKLLTGGERDRPSRQQTLRGAIDWSHSLLEAGDEALFARLSVFSGGCSFEAAEAVCGEDLTLDMLDGLASLVEESLVRQEGEDEPRFMMLETIREYASEKLVERGEQRGLLERHARFFLHMAKEAEDEMRGPKHAEWVQRLDMERDNFRSALRFVLNTGDAEAALQMCHALFSLWYVRAYLDEGRRWMAEVLAAEGAADETLRTGVLRGAGALAAAQGDYEHSLQLLEKSLALARAIGNELGVSDALNSLAIVAGEQGNLAKAIALLEERLQIVRRLNDGWRLGITLMNLGVMAGQANDFVRAKQYFEESLALARRVGDLDGVATCLIDLGGLATIVGNMDEAASWYAEGVPLAIDLGDIVLVADAFDGIARVLVAQERLDEAVQIYAAAAASRERVGAVPAGNERDDLERRYAHVRERLGDERWNAAWRTGRDLTGEEAMEWVFGHSLAK